jgi:hypothetical protein
MGLCFSARLDMALMAPLSDVDYTSYLDTQSRPPDVHRGTVHVAHVRVSLCGSIAGTQQAS